MVVDVGWGASNMQAKFFEAVLPTCAVVPPVIYARKVF